MADEGRNYTEDVLERHRKAWIVGGIGAAIGGGIGGYISVVKGSYIYAGVGAGFGAILGEVIGLLINRKVSMLKVVSVRNKWNFILGLLSILFAFLGLIMFFISGEWIGVAGAAFFGLGGIYLLRQK